MLGVCGVGCDRVEICHELIGEEFCFGNEELVKKNLSCGLDSARNLVYSLREMSLLASIAKNFFYKNFTWVDK